MTKPTTDLARPLSYQVLLSTGEIVVVDDSIGFQSCPAGSITFVSAAGQPLHWFSAGTVRAIHAKDECGHPMEQQPQGD